MSIQVAILTGDVSVNAACASRSRAAISDLGELVAVAVLCQNLAAEMDWPEPTDMLSKDNTELSAGANIRRDISDVNTLGIRLLDLRVNCSSTGMCSMNIIIAKTGY